MLLDEKYYKNPKEKPKVKEKNIRFIGINENWLKDCNYKIYLKFQNDSYRKPNNDEKYRYYYKKDLNKSEWAESIGMSLNTFKKDFETLVSKGVIKLCEDDVYRLYDLQTDKGFFCKIHPLEMEKLLSHKDIKSEHCKLFLIYRSYSNNDKLCYATRQTLARALGFKQRRAFLEGRSDVEFNERTLDRIGELSKLLEELDLIEVSRNKKCPNVVKCKYTNNYYLSKEYNSYESIKRREEKANREATESDWFPF